MSPNRIAFVVPGDLAGLTGGYGYDRQIIAGLRDRGWTVDLVLLGDGFPWPDAMALRQAAAQIAAIPDGTTVVADGLAFGALPALAATHAARLRWVALVHHPLALESGLHDRQRRQLLDSERRALANASTVIVTSAATARALADYGVAARRLQVVMPGTAAAPLATGSPASSGALSLLCVATLIPRKGHTLLIEALADLQDRDWTLHCVGSTTHDAATADSVRAAIASHGLGARVQLHGEVDADALQAFYDHADVFVLPSLHEGYGMALAEALARGLPVVSSTAGAIADTVLPAAGLLLPPGDGAALRHALARVLDEPALRAGLAAGARAARQQLPSWAQAVERFADVLRAGLAQAGAMSRPNERAAAAGFSAEWLSLREPFDLAARAVGAAQPAMDAHLTSLRAAGAALGVLDLACGQGANLRALAPRLGGAQRWRLLDQDPALLAALPVALQRWARQQGYRYATDGAVRACRIDGSGLSASVSWDRFDLAQDVDALDIAHTALITASALLDLVSAAWLQRLVERSRSAGAAMLWALTVDGRMLWDPADPDDVPVHALFCSHQHRDKGFGPALGPQAPAIALAQLAEAGYRSTSTRTDWRVAGEQGLSMQRAMIDGVAAAALEQDPSVQARIRAWQARRAAVIERSSLQVGHLDILATLR